MKNILIWILGIVILLVIPSTFSIYLYKTQNCNLEKINYAVQIGYSCIICLVTIFALYIAYKQLTKTRESTNIQSLNNFIERYNNKDMREKRIALANNILNKEVSFDKNISNFKNFYNGDKTKIAKIKNLIESVIYEFEVLGYFEEREIYELKDVYELFSYELQRYWLIVKFELNFINYIRKSEGDYYNKFENLFKKLIKYELKSTDKKINLQNLKALISKKRNELENFLLEESKLQENEQ